MTQEEIHSQLILAALTWDHSIQKSLGYYFGKSRIEWTISIKAPNWYKFESHCGPDLDQLFAIVMEKINNHSIEQTLTK